MKTVLCILLMTIPAVVDEGRQSNPTNLAAIPESAKRLFKTTGLDRQYEFGFTLKPSHLSGDFDGDGKPDTAIIVRKKGTEKVGIAVCHSSTNKVSFIGAGTEVGNGGDNFDWMDMWKVVPKPTAAKQLGKAASLLKGDAIHVEKSESASALVYWTGRRYVWRQLGD
jgi:hypothetical protein